MLQMWGHYILSFIKSLNRGHVMKKIAFHKKIVLLGMVCLLLIFLLPLAKHAILTQLYSHEFEELYVTIGTFYGPIEDNEKVRVLSYSNNSARIYITSHYSGSVHVFFRNGEMWEQQSSVDLWSRYGSADDFIWPYFYHSPGGLAFVILLAVVGFLFFSLIVFVCAISSCIVKKVKKKPVKSQEL